MKLTNYLYKFTLILGIILIPLIISSKIKIERKNNTLINRTMYYYYDGDVSFDKKRMNSLDRFNIGCIKGNYALQDYSILSNQVAIGRAPEENEVVMAREYCEESVVYNEYGSSRIEDKCSSEYLENKIKILDKEYPIVGILDKNVIEKNLYFDLNNLPVNYNLVFVNSNTLNNICGENNNLYRIVFKNYKDIDNFKHAGNKTIIYTDIEVNRETTYLLIVFIITLISNVGLYIIKRKYGINKR